MFSSLARTLSQSGLSWSWPSLSRTAARLGVLSSSPSQRLAEMKVRAAGWVEASSLVRRPRTSISCGQNKLATLSRGSLFLLEQVVVGLHTRPGDPRESTRRERAATPGTAVTEAALALRTSSSSSQP